MVTRLIIFIAFTFTCAAQPWWTPPVASAVDSDGLSYYPTNTAELPVMWYDADAITGKSAGNLVTNWADSSASGFTLSNTGNGVQPYYTNNASVLNGKPWLYFSTNDKLLHGGGNFAQANTIFAVIIYLSGNGDFYSGTNSATENRLNVSSTSWRWSGGSAVSGASGAVVAGTPTLVEINFNGSTSHVWTNGVAYYSGFSNAGSEPLTGFIVGADTSGSFYVTAGIAEIVVYDTMPSDAERGQLRTNYFGAKYAPNGW